MDKFTVTRYLDNWEQRRRESLKGRKLARSMALWGWAAARFVILFGLAFILLYPLLYMISLAFRPSSEVLDPMVIWVPRTLTMENFVKVLDAMDYVQAVRNTLLICMGSSLILIVSCALTGYGFARFQFRGQKVMMAVLLFSIIVPPQTLILPQYLENAKFDFFFALPVINAVSGLFGAAPVEPVNLLDTPWTFYLPALFASGIRSGLLIYVFRQFFKGMPNELEDAAHIDGAGPVRTFLRVMAPNALPAFVTVFLFSTVWYWNDYFYSSTFLTGTSTVSVKLSFLQSYLSTTNNFNQDPYQYITQMQAGCLLTIAPPLVIYIIFQRYFTESIERTGIVG